MQGTLKIALLLFVWLPFRGMTQGSFGPMRIPMGLEHLRSPRSLLSVNSSALMPRPSQSNPVSPSYYTRHLGFFCRQELLRDMWTPMPLRFRLGSVDYVDRLERKPHARGPLP